MKFQSVMEVGGVKEEVERVATMFFKRSFMEMMGGDGNIDGQNR